MAVLTTTLAPIFDTDANFRLCGKAVSDQMLAGSWVKTTDTGQIDWTTAVKPAAANTSQGYEMWRSNDASGGIVQIYVKIEYGSSGIATAPSFWITVGFGSNGTGSLTGTTTTRTQMHTVSNTSATLRTSYLSVSAGRFCFAMFNSDASASILISLERTIDSSLALQNEILITYCQGATVLNFRQVLSQSGGVYPSIIGGITAVMPVNTDSLQSGNAGIAMMSGQRGGFTNPSSNLIGTWSTNLGATGTQINVTTYNTAINYIVIASHTLAASNTILMRYE